jgi:hypothetical protein
MIRSKILKLFETIEPSLEKLKMALTEILIRGYELGYYKSVELQKSYTFNIITKVTILLY